jgi:GNAT superfamily N-acetyltransferase
VTQDRSPDLTREWRRRLDDEPWVDLTRELARFPELEGAVALPELQTIPQEGAYVAAADRGVVVELGLVWESASGARAGTFSLDVHTADRVILLHDMHIAPSLQGLGAGREIVRQVVALADELGIERIRAHANDVGRYAWARCGFDFDPELEHQHVIAAAEQFAGSLNRHFDSAGIDHSWELAEFPGDPVSLAELAEVRGEPAPEGEAPPFSFGQALLLGPPSGNEWFGVFDLAPGSPSREQLARYV